MLLSLHPSSKFVVILFFQIPCSVSSVKIQMIYGSGSYLIFPLLYTWHLNQCLTGNNKCSNVFMKWMNTFIYPSSLRRLLRAEIGPIAHDPWVGEITLITQTGIQCFQLPLAQMVKSRLGEEGGNVKIMSKTQRQYTDKEPVTSTVD